MPESYLESLNQNVAGQLGEPVFYAGNIEVLVANLGGTRTRATIKKDLAGKAVDLAGLGIKRAAFGVSEGANLYAASVVWQYLQELERRGKIYLYDRGITTIDDAIERQLHVARLGTVGSKGRKVTHKTPSEAYGGGQSQENALKALEERS